MQEYGKRLTVSDLLAILKTVDPTTPIEIEVRGEHGIVQHADILEAGTWIRESGPVFMIEGHHPASPRTARSQLVREHKAP